MEALSPTLDKSSSMSVPNMTLFAGALKTRTGCSTSTATEYVLFSYSSGISSFIQNSHDLSPPFLEVAKVRSFSHLDFVYCGSYGTDDL